MLSPENPMKAIASMPAVIRAIGTPFIGAGTSLVYGLAIGAITACIRRWGAYPEGMSFAILLMNGATPLINRYFKPERFSIHQATPQ